PHTVGRVTTSTPVILLTAEEAGRETIAVNPRHTSQTCADCGHVEARNRDATVFCCRRCGHVAHADVNAARNILRAGLAQRPEREADQHARVRSRDLFVGRPLLGDVAE
ncbi:MAG: transposase, partial [Acidimicrobiia bacterium]